MSVEKLTVLHCTEGTSDKLYVFYRDSIGDVCTYSGKNGGKLINQGYLYRRFLPSGYDAALEGKLKKGYVKLDITKPLEASILRSLCTVLAHNEVTRAIEEAKGSEARSGLGAINLKNLSSLLSSS